MTPTYKPGDPVTRTGESAMGIKHGGTYAVVKAFPAFRGSSTWWLKFNESGSAQFRARGFRPANRKGGES